MLCLDTVPFPVSTQLQIKFVTFLVTNLNKIFKELKFMLRIQAVGAHFPRGIRANKIRNVFRNVFSECGVKMYHKSLASNPYKCTLTRCDPTETHVTVVIGINS